METDDVHSDINQAATGSAHIQRVKHNLQSTHTLAYVLPSRRECSVTLQPHTKSTGGNSRASPLPSDEVWGRGCLPGVLGPLVVVGEGEIARCAHQPFRPGFLVPTLACPISGTLTLNCNTKDIVFEKPKRFPRTKNQKLQDSPPQKKYLSAAPSNVPHQ